jgi:hypothetical protein
MTENIWQGIVNQKLIRLYAGKVGDTPSQGILYIDIMNENHSTIEMKRILTPSKDGAVEVTKEEGNIITLTSEKGTTIYFDANTMSFKIDSIL